MENYDFRYDWDNEFNNLNITDYSIHDKLTAEQIEELFKIFKIKDVLSYVELRQTLEQFNIVMNDDQYKKIFFKINLNSYNVISWDEFISFIIFSFRQDDSQNQKDSLVLPISMEPIIKQSCHKTQIIGISLMRNLDNDDEDEFGTYLTVSKDGFINFWTPEYDINKNGLSKSQYLQYTPTLVLGVVALPNVRIICISSTERELRFYDVMATNFHLRLIIRSVPGAIHRMSYSYKKSNLKINSKLLMGDMNGNVYSIEFSPILRGPFQSKAGSMLMEYTWNELLKKNFPIIIAKEYPMLFPSYITKMFYSIRDDILYVSAEGHGHTGGLAAIDGRGIRTNFLMPQGVTSFAFDEQSRILATGGPDKYLRLWDPFLPSKASAVLSGHHAGIMYIFIQMEESKCYSIDKAKIIKIWHLFDLTLLQTYSELLFYTPNETFLTYYYNKTARELIVGGRKFIAIKCCLKHKLDLTDGYTHTAAISVVLYNHLFENIVTCGLDSYIIVWDLWTGKRQLVMKGCHTQNVMGETINLEITAATFNPQCQFLLTGARDGSLKIWNYNNAACIRNMNIDEGCEVTGVIWLTDRILAVGWNRRVTEFGDISDGQYNDTKNWYKVHLDDILAVAYKIGETLITGSSIGELILWKIDTGQPYRKYDVADPTKYIPVLYEPKAAKPVAEENLVKEQPIIDIANLTRHSVSNVIMTRHYTKRGIDSVDKGERDSEDIDIDNTVRDNIEKKHITRRLDSHGVAMPLPLVHDNHSSSEMDTAKIGIQAILFLKARPQTKEHGTVVVSLDNGYVQFYSHHQLGGFINEFYSIHKSGDYCLSLATDKENKFLLTGTAFGYIKVWLLQNYCIPISEHTHVCKPLLRLQFYFMIADRVIGRAKRVALNKDPLLLNSYKAHLKGITSIVYIEHSKLVLTGSNDYSVRMWTLGGQYIGTLGGHVPMKQLERNTEFHNDEVFRIPPDINKVASSTTMKVLTGTSPDPLGEFIKTHVNDKNEEKESDLLSMPITVTTIKKPGRNKSCTLNKLREPILGKNTEFFQSELIKHNPILDKNLPHIPVYTHLKIHNAKIIERPSTPECLKKLKKIKYMSYYTAKK